MARLSRTPTGIVTFLFTDIEGSTRMWDEVPDAMTGAMARHDEILDATIDRHSGFVFKHTGDGICAAFQSPTDALAAAVAVQDAFRAEVFESIGHILVRVALHTGEAEELHGDYRGPALNRVARLLDVAVGGDILLSEAAEENVRATLPRDVKLADLGEHRLRDIRESGHVFFVESPGLQRSERKTTPWIAAAVATVLVAGAITVFSLASPPGTGTPETTSAVPGPTTTAAAPGTTEPLPDTSPKWALWPGGDINGLLAGDGVLIAASRSTGLHAFRTEDAGPAWADPGLIVDLDQPLIEPFGAPVVGKPVSGSGAVFYSTFLGTLHAVDAGTGSLLWSHEFRRCLEDECTPLVPSEPALLDEAVLVTAGSDLFRFAVTTGDYEQVAGGFGAASAGPSVGGEFIYVAEGTSVFRFETDNLSPLQALFVADDVTVGYQAEVEALLTPSLPSDFGLDADHGLFIRDAQGFVTRRSPSNGSVHPAWRDSSGVAVRVEAANTPAVGPGLSAGDVPVLWSVDLGGQLIGTDARSGRRVAEHPVGPTTNSVAVGADGTVFVATDTPELVAYEPVQNSELFRESLVVAPSSGPVVLNGRVFVAGIDGSVRAYARGGEVPIDRALSSPVAFPGAITDVAWSPTGDFAFVYAGDVWLSTDQEVVNLTASRGGGLSPDWSPDGTRLAYVSGSPGRDVYVIRADGSNRRNLTETTDADELEPAWSPDGSRVVFSSQACADQGGPQPERICSGVSTLNRADLAGGIRPVIGTPVVIASDRDPDWSPAGDRVVFSSDRPVGGLPIGTRTHLWTVGTVGTDLVAVPDELEVGGRDPAYSPDGRHIAFVAGGGPGGGPALYVTDLDSETTTRLVNLPIGAGAPTWSPDGSRVAFAWELSTLGRIYTVSAGG